MSKPSKPAKKSTKPAPSKPAPKPTKKMAASKPPAKPAPKPVVKSAPKPAAKAPQKPVPAKGTNKVERSTYLTVHNVVQMITKKFAEQTNGALTTTRFEVLNAIKSMDLPTQTDLVNATGIDRSTMATVMREVSNLQLIIRVRNKVDTRSYDISLTKAGETVLAAGKKAMSAIEKELSSVQGYDTFVRYAERINKELGTTDDEEAEESKPSTSTATKQAPKALSKPKATSKSKAESKPAEVTASDSSGDDNDSLDLSDKPTSSGGSHKSKPALEYADADTSDDD